MIWLKGIIYKTQIPNAKVCVQYHTWKSLNFDLTGVKAKIKHKILLAIPRLKSSPLEHVSPSSKGESASEQAELLPEHFPPPFLPRIITWIVRRDQPPFPKAFSCSLPIAKTRFLRMEPPTNRLMKLPGLQQGLNPGGWPSVCVLQWEWSISHLPCP